MTEGRASSIAVSSVCSGESFSLVCMHPKENCVNSEYVSEYLWLGRSYSNIPFRSC